MKTSTLNNDRPSEGYVIEVGGKFDSEYGSFTEALKAGLGLKNKYAQAQVKVYDANERSHAEPSEPAETDTPAAS